MAQTWTCDGCGCPAKLADLTPVGQYDPVAFCNEPDCQCLTKWHAHVAAVDAQRIEVVTAFEAWRKAERAALGMQALPDE